LGDGDEEEDEDEEEGEISPSLPSSPLKTSPRLATILANKRSSLLACARQNALGRELGHLLPHRHSPILRWYILTCRE
jgi:hypothetical protein